MAGRVSQTVLEVDAQGNPTGRVSQVVEEIAADGTPTGRVTQVVVSTGAYGAPKARVSQTVLESLAPALPHSRVAQIVVEILVLNWRVGMPSVYPALPGQPAFSIVKRPKFQNAEPQQHTSGREVRIGYAEYPLWEFDLTYEVLRNRPTDIEYRTYLGFFLSLNGSLNGFLFREEDDNQVKHQSFVTTDGVNSEFGPLVRTYGAGGFTGTEPVGYVDLTQPFNLYVDGVLVDPSDATWGYSVLTTQPVNQQVKFNNTPATGHVLTVDMSFFYYCRFADDQMDFEEFMHQLYTLKKVTLMSLRG